MIKRILLILCATFLAMEMQAEKSIYVPTFGGTFRTRYEYLPKEEKSAFKVRDLRLSVDGYVAPIMSYRGEVDFADWGRITLIDAYIRLTPIKGLNFSMGQVRMPFTIAAHRMPCQQYFVNRTFLAKQVGSIRDVGLTGSYAFDKIPLTVQAGIYNCSGTGVEQSFYTGTFGYSVKVISPFAKNWYAAACTARLTRGVARAQMWDIGGYFDNGLWHVEAEYLRKNYVHGMFEPVNACDFFVYRNFPIEKKMVAGISGALRYDYMGDHSSGKANENNVAVIDDFERHRITAGATLSLQTKFQADIRLNYEKYFYNKGIVPGMNDDDRLVVELIAHF